MGPRNEQILSLSDVNLRLLLLSILTLHETVWKFKLKNRHPSKKF
jgi:hypothetical protein